MHHPTEQCNAMQHVCVYVLASTAPSYLQSVPPSAKATTPRWFSTLYISSGWTKTFGMLPVKMIY